MVREIPEELRPRRIQVTTDSAPAPAQLETAKAA
jgi:hypothetical protein